LQLRTLVGNGLDRFSKQASLASFSPYFLLYSCKHVLLVFIRMDLQSVVKMDDLNEWVEVCKIQVQLFEKVMPMALEKLAIYIVEHFATCHDRDRDEATYCK